MKKFGLLSAIVGAAMFLTSNASAVMGLLTISGTGEIQSITTNANTFVALKRSIAQKDILFILARATGDQSITNKSTKLFFNPDALNTNLTAWTSSHLTNNSFGYTTNTYGIFYYSNSVAGLVTLDGTDGDGNYYSYMEFDYYNPAGPANGPGFAYDGFWNPAAMEGNNIVNVPSNNGMNATVTGNAILYIHDNKYDYNLLGILNLFDGVTPSGTPSQFYLATDILDPSNFSQNYAIVLHGAVAFKYSASQNKSKNTETAIESFTLKGSGDMNYNQNDGTISGTATFSGKETAPIPPQ